MFGYRSKIFMSSMINALEKGLPNQLIIDNQNSRASILNYDHLIAKAIKSLSFVFAKDGSMILIMKMPVKISWSPRENYTRMLSSFSGGICFILRLV